MVNALLLSCAHIYKMYYYYGYWGVEATQVLMMNFTKMSALAINYRDGGLSEDRQNKELRASKSPLPNSVFSHFMLRGEGLFG